LGQLALMLEFGLPAFRANLFDADLERFRRKG